MQQHTHISNTNAQIQITHLYSHITTYILTNAQYYKLRIHKCTNTHSKHVTTIHTLNNTANAVQFRCVLMDGYGFSIAGDRCRSSCSCVSSRRTARSRTSWSRPPSNQSTTENANKEQQINNTTSTTTTTTTTTTTATKTNDNDSSNNHNDNTTNNTYNTRDI